MGQSAPQKLAVPCAAIGAPRKLQTELVEALHDAEGCALLGEQIKDPAHRALDFPIGVEDDLVVFEDEADRQRETQLALGGFIQLAAVEARADDVQLGLRERALHPQDQGVVEVGWIVAPVLVDHESSRDRAKLEKTMPVLVRSREPRRFQGEDRADASHRHVADQDLEVLPIGHRRAGLAEIPIENPDLLGPPAERLGFGRQVVLALRALLIEADLPHRRLADINAGLPRQLSFGDLRNRAHQAPPDRTAGRRQQDRTRSCLR